MRPAQLLILVLLVAGCPAPVDTPDSGGGTGGGQGSDAGHDAGRPVRDAGVPDAGFGVVAVSKWCEADAVARCLRELRCLRISEPMLQTCFERRQAGCDQVAFTRAVQEGRLAYSAGEATKCLDAFGTGSCSDTPAACATVFAGRVPPDGGCVQASECDGDGYCTVNDGLCPHRCRGWVPRGGSCDVFGTIRCDPRHDSCYSTDGGALFCLPSRDAGAGCTRDECAPDHTCQAGTCVKTEARLGETCFAAGYPRCIGDSFCREDAGVCAPLAGVGGACVNASSCVSTLRCSGVISTGTCEGKRPLGSPCANGGDCEGDLYCAGSSGRCEQLPGGLDGGDCSLGVTGYRCDARSFCLHTVQYDFECRTLRGLGEACDYGAMCASTECEGGVLSDGGFGRHCVERCSVRADGG